MYKPRMVFATKRVRVVFLAAAMVAASTGLARAQDDRNPIAPKMQFQTDQPTGAGDGSDALAAGLFQYADELWARGTALNRDASKREQALEFLHKADETLAQIQRDYPLWKPAMVLERRAMIQSALSHAAGKVDPAETPYRTPADMKPKNPDADYTAGASVGKTTGLSGGTSTYVGGGDYSPPSYRRNSPNLSNSNGSGLAFGIFARVLGVLIALIYLLARGSRNKGFDPGFKDNKIAKSREEEPRRTRRSGDYDY